MHIKPYSGRQFLEGERVQVRCYIHPNRRWEFGTVIHRLGRLHYTILTDGGKLYNEASLSPVQEARLLESEDECSESPPLPCLAPLSPPLPPACDCYLDRKPETSYLRFSTLYYPARPHYRRLDDGGLAPRRRVRRYFERSRELESTVAPHNEVAARSAAFRRLLEDTPNDLSLWMQFIDFQYATLLRDLLLQGNFCSLISTSCIFFSHILARRERALRAVVPAGAALGAAGAERAAAAALRDPALPARAYPDLLYVYGCVLAAAGLWETLTLLVELAAAMNFPPSEQFPPRDLDPHAEERLERAEASIAVSGLPLSARWARVERARAAAHWRPAAAGQ
ncbi:hypothetical protein ACJJTC_007426 [Scirpophaga incertulas]